MRSKFVKARNSFSKIVGLLDLSRTKLAPSSNNTNTNVWIPLKPGTSLSRAKQSAGNFQRWMAATLGGLSSDSVKVEISPLLVKMTIGYSASWLAQHLSPQQPSSDRHDATNEHNSVLRTIKGSRRVLVRPPLPNLGRHFSRYPALRQAFQSVCRRYANIQGLCGIGIGRRYREKTRSYAKPTRRDRDVIGSMSIKLYVREKLPQSRVSPSEKIPRWIMVRDPLAGRMVRVPLDVMSVGVPRLSQDRNIGTASTSATGAGFIAPGNQFHCGIDGAQAPSGPVDPQRFIPGTCGALIRRLDGITFATSAAHVFLVTCSQEFLIPDKSRQVVGYGGSNWVALPDTSFLPQDIRLTTDSISICDALLFVVPSLLVPGSNVWPPNFLKRFSTAAEIEAACQREDVTGFIWVQRGTIRDRIQIDLHSAIQSFTTSVRCGDREVEFNFGFVWHLILKSGATQGGDSGAPVFLELSSSGGCSLLGFHFLHNERKQTAYAVDARSFLQGLVGSMGVHYSFAE